MSKLVTSQALDSFGETVVDDDDTEASGPNHRRQQ